MWDFELDMLLGVRNYSEIWVFVLFTDILTTLGFALQFILFYIITLAVGGIMICAIRYGWKKYMLDLLKLIWLDMKRLLLNGFINQTDMI